MLLHLNIQIGIWVSSRAQKIIKFHSYCWLFSPRFLIALCRQHANSRISSINKKCALQEENRRRINQQQPRYLCASVVHQLVSRQLQQPFEKPDLILPGCLVARGPFQTFVKSFRSLSNRVWKVIKVTRKLCFPMSLPFGSERVRSDLEKDCHMWPGYDASMRHCVLWFPW